MHSLGTEPMVLAPLAASSIVGDAIVFNVLNGVDFLMCYWIENGIQHLDIFFQAEG